MIRAGKSLWLRPISQVLGCFVSGRAAYALHWLGPGRVRLRTPNRHQDHRVIRLQALRGCPELTRRLSLCCRMSYLPFWGLPLPGRSCRQTMSRLISSFPPHRDLRQRPSHRHHQLRSLPFLLRPLLRSSRPSPPVGNEIADPKARRLRAYPL